MSLASRVCPLFADSNIDLDAAGDLLLKTGKKLYLDDDKTMYIVTADGTTFDFYIGSAKKGEISAAGFQAL